MRVEIVEAALTFTMRHGKKRSGKILSHMCREAVDLIE